MKRRVWLILFGLGLALFGVLAVPALGWPGEVRGLLLGIGGLALGEFLRGSAGGAG